MKQVLFLWLAMVAFLPAIAQNQTITGKVTDAKDGSSLPGVTVVVKGSTKGTLSKSDGTYAIEAPSGSTVVFSFMGYLSKEIIVSTSATYNISLSLNDKVLEEVVVNGYGSTSRRKYNGAVTVIGSEKMENVPVATFDQMLQGRAPGLYSTSGSGQPGAANRVVIRGASSISGLTSPLYVVDGVPVETGAFAAMNANDFESVSVLKDANATALYGSRGANGVIVITTKRGKEGRVVFSLKTQHGFSNRTRPRFDMMNADQRLKFEEEIGAAYNYSLGPGWELSPLNPANANLTEGQKAANKSTLDSLRNLNTDWRKIFFRDRAAFQEHELAASGGTEKVRFYSALNYYKQQGIALRSGLERYSFRTNVDFKGDRFTGAINTSIGYANINSIEAENSTAVVNPFAAVYYALPYEYPYINGVLVHSGNAAQYGVWDQREGSDALERTLNTTAKQNQLKGAISLNLRYDLHKNLYARTQLGMDYRESATSRYVNPNSYVGSQSTGRQGSYGEGLARYYQFTSTSGLTYHNTFAVKHGLEVTALYEFNRIKATSMSYTGYGINPLFPETPVGITPGNNTNGFIPTIGGGKSGSALASFIGLVKYGFADKYTLNFTLRRDGSTTVPEKNRWHNFWSVGAGWDLMKEDFIRDIRHLSALRARVSYGTSASPFASYFGYTPTYGPTRYGGAPGIYPDAIGNPEYDWEYTKTFNAGFDASAFDSRLRLTVDWYNKVTNNLFISEQLSRTSGFSGRSINAGALRNRGIEVDLSGDIVKTANLTWYAGANFAYNKNVVTNLGGVNEFISGTSIVRVGLPIGSHYAVKWAGIDPKNGKTQYYQADGKIAPNYAYNDNFKVAEYGTYNPPFIGGFNTGINWKGLTVEAFFSFASGFKRFNNEDFFNQNYSFATSNQSTQWLRRWKKAEDITDIQAFGDPRRFSSRDIQDASYIRFRNLNVGYSLPKAWLSRTNLISQVHIYVQAQNIFTLTSWTGFDPEDNNNIAQFEYPAARTYTAGVKVNF